jgi:hypothetical protein
MFKNYIDSDFPICYRLIRRGDGNGNMEPVLQGHFLFTGTDGAIVREWRDLQTQDFPYIEDNIPFGRARAAQKQADA